MLALRPPGALAEDDFNAACIKCGQCVEACPYDTLKLARAGADVPIGTPYFEPREIPCYMCPDIPCMKACPTGALAAELKDITKARMGLAVIDMENCLSWQGLRCEICYRVCPLKDKAITLENSSAADQQACHVRADRPFARPAPDAASARRPVPPKRPRSGSCRQAGAGQDRRAITGWAGRRDDRSPRNSSRRRRRPPAAVDRRPPETAPGMDISMRG